MQSGGGNSSDRGRILTDAVDLLRPQQQRKQGRQSTSIPGYPLFICWGRFGGIEFSERGIRKAFLLLPYVQTGQRPMKKFSGHSTLEQPLDIAMSGSIVFNVISFLNLKSQQISELENC